MLLIELDCSGGRVRGGHGIAFGTQEFTESLGQLAIVIHDQNLDVGCVAHNATAAFACQMGNSTAALVPSPGELSIRIWPPCSVTMFLAMARPRPVPLPIGLVVKNGSNMCA